MTSLWVTVTPGALCFTCGFQCSAFWTLTVNRERVGVKSWGTNKAKQSLLFTARRRQTLRGEGCGRVKHSSHGADGLRIFIKPTRHHVRRALLKKSSSQMDRFSQIYLLQRSFHTDYATVSQHGWTPRLDRSLPTACLAQGESDVGQMEGNHLSAPSSEQQEQISGGCTTFLTCCCPCHHKRETWGVQAADSLQNTDKTDRNKKKRNVRHIF